ncbi:MAG: DDE-type integrase/transposase/recombinase [Oscillospiraceae bacterium]|nr:DDE-type integrase/transposase/recombinase [Oscillospiraceae bacterium]
MNILTQEARQRQAVVKLAMRKGKKFAAEKHGVSLSSVKRWCRRYDGTWQSLREKSHRPHSHPAQHTPEEEALIREAFAKVFDRYGWYEVFRELQSKGYQRSFSGMVYAAKRMGLAEAAKKKPRKHERRYPELLIPGQKVQIDVKEVPYNCLRGALLRDGQHLYQWTAIDECTRLRFVYGDEEHTPANTVDFFKRLQKAFPFPIQTVQTDNGTEFTYKYISENTINPFDTFLNEQKIPHVLIPPRTPWHNGKVERSHRNDQRYFYDWEHFRSLADFNQKLAEHLSWSNHRPMRTLNWESPLQRLSRFTPAEQDSAGDAGRND